jgi:hypothetical protein
MKDATAIILVKLKIRAKERKVKSPIYEAGAGGN